MCSTDRQEVESLKSTLFRAGIRSEIQTNPLAQAMGITRLEVLVHERDMVRASKLREQHQPVVLAEAKADRPKAGETANGFGNTEELVLEPDAIPFPSLGPIRREAPGLEHQPGNPAAGGEFAEAAALLEKEVEELLLRGSKSADRCRALEEKAHALDRSLAQAKADLAREASGRSLAEEKLAQVSQTYASLQEERQALEVRCRASDQALAAAQTRLESQAREASVQLEKIADLGRELVARQTQLKEVAQSLAAARAGIEHEKELRLAAEQKSADLAAGRKSLENQLAHHAEQQKRLLSERQEEHDQFQACVGKVNNLRVRLRAKLAKEQD
jgi:hypothetical protein